MTSIKVKFRPSTIKHREGTVYYQIIHHRKVGVLNTGYKLHASEWDSRRATPVCSDNTARYSYLSAIKENIDHDLARITAIITRLNQSPVEYTVSDIIARYNLYIRHYSLSRYMTRLIDTLHARGRHRTAETYTATLRSFLNFNNGHDIMLDAITSDTMQHYEAHLRKRGNIPNTTSFYMRTLRAVYNHAADDDIINNQYPFRRVYTGIDKTVKRALPLDSIRKIKKLDLTDSPAVDYARDMFILSFMLRGMSFIDMAFLLKTDLHAGILTYRRRKTGRTLAIAWTGEMQKILDKYPPNATPYLLPIITRPYNDEISAYRNIAQRINKHLRIIASKAGISVTPTMYSARHSWASAAKTKGIPLGVISEGMGHESESTTRIYLASLDNSAVDTANSIIISDI